MDNQAAIELVLASVTSDRTDPLSFIMNMDESSVPDSPDPASGLSTDKSATDRQLASLQTYIDSVPYKCESVDEMLAKLEFIVGRIDICVRSKNWTVLTSWDGMLQCWMLMRYPIPTPTRAKLARLYYELTVLPGVEPRVVRQWADMVTRLTANKRNARRKLEATDLQLPWQPLWRALKKELWPKKRIHEDSRNMLNILLYVAEQCKRYFPASEIPNMLSTFLPMLTQDSILSMIPVLTSFLPPTHIHLYVPPLFKLWEAFNSNVTDERLIEMCGELSEEHVAGKSATVDGYGGTEWKDVGIWTEAEWTMLVGKALGSMNVPVGVTRGASTTALHADTMGEKLSLRIKRSANRYNALAKVFVYSMAVDGPSREETVTPSGSKQVGYIAGSRALDSLDKLITSTESFFHPSNSGAWSIILTNFLQRLAAEFCKRWKEEEQPSCKIPITHRLTPAIRKSFVMSLRTPALLAMFSKDPLSMSFAQGALRAMALLEPGLIMPDVLERAYGGLEAINETHRTTAVLSTLSGVVLPLVSEKRWLGGQKHILPLLELSLPGIDLNDPIKTVCTTMFIVAVVQAGIKIGDSHQAGLPFGSDAPGEGMVIDDEVIGVPEGVEPGSSILNKDEERSLVRDSTAGFADWVTTLFRRVFALLENLPEEGGKRNSVPQQEEGVIRSVKSTLDIVCLHLSDSLFDLVLKLVFEYATTNAKSNAVKAFGQLVSCLARARPDKTIDKFLPFCINQIQEELKHGASSVRTTSSHAAVPSDTTLHWNLSILRGCLGYGATSLLKHKDEIIGLLRLLTDKTKSERGYSSTGRLLTRITHALSATYPLNNRFVNTDEWDSPEFDQQHYLHWGRLYEAQDVKIEWHVPSPGEVTMILDILDQIGSPILEKLDALMDTTEKWDHVARNDFCRSLHAIRSIWEGLSSLLQEQPKKVVSPCTYEDTEADRLLVSTMTVNAGFALSDSNDPRYQKASAHRERFGNMLHRAAISIALRRNSEGEDHIDAVLSIAKGMDVFLLEYGMSRSGYDALQKNYSQVRDINRMSFRQKENARLVFLKRAQLYHASRLYLNSLYRRRSGLDDKLIGDLVELSLSPYTRVRRHCQTILLNVTGYYVRSTRFFLPTLFDALAIGTDPDRMKGALYMLWDKGIAAYSLSDITLRQRYLLSLLECQHQEKPSIQKLVLSLAHDCLNQLTAESVHTHAYLEDTPRLTQALQELETEFSEDLIDQGLLTEALDKVQARFTIQQQRHAQMITSILEITSRPVTHWRYVEIAARFLYHLLQRNVCPSPQLARFFLENCVSPHPNTRAYAVRGIIKIFVHVKIRTYSTSPDELWFEEWTNPLVKCIPVSSHAGIMQRLEDPSDDVYVDKIRTGFLMWTEDVKAYAKVGEGASPLIWESESQTSIDSLADGLGDVQFFDKLITLWAQESSRSDAVPELRSDHVQFIKSIAKMFEDRYLDTILSGVQPLLTDPDRYKQRAGAEILVGLLRGSKHWPKQKWDILWIWTLQRMDQIFAQIKPDTLPFWESVFNSQLGDRDSRRSAPLVQWMLNLPLDFQGDSAFTMSKTLALFGVVLGNMSPRSSSMSDQIFKVLLDNANTGYNEMRGHIASALSAIISFQWYPAHQSVESFLKACRDTTDPLEIRTARYMENIVGVVQNLPKWKVERLPPPRTNQSQYDKVGLTLLQWLWSIAHGSTAPLIFRYIMPILPEILHMSELNDSSELQMYATAVLYVLSAVTPPREYVEVILSHFVQAIKSSTSWRIRLNALPTVVVFFYRNLLSISNDGVTQVMEVLLDCLGDENVEVREMASKALSGVVRCSQRQSIIPLKNRFVRQIRKSRLPSRQEPEYAESLRLLHSTVLGLCALIESFPYSVEPWMPSLTDVLSTHVSDPPPISTAIRKCASEFKKTHQDTWAKDQLLFDEDQLQNLSTMLVGTSYYA